MRVHIVKVSHRANSPLDEAEDVADCPLPPAPQHLHWSCSWSWCLWCTGTDTWQDVLSSGSRPPRATCPRAVSKAHFTAAGSLGESSYLPAAADHWANLRSCVARVLRVIAAGAKQACLCLCVWICLTTLRQPVSTQPLLHGQRRGAGGKVARPDGRRETPWEIRRDAPSGSGRPWLPLNTFFRKPHRSNSSLKSMPCCHSGARRTNRGRAEGFVSHGGEKLTGVSKVVVLRWKAAWILVRLVSLSLLIRTLGEREWRVFGADSHSWSLFLVQYVDSGS